MAAKKTLTPRQRTLERIMTAIATFIVQETYTDEAEVQSALASAIGLIEKAQAKLNDPE